MLRIQVHPDELKLKARFVQQCKQELNRMLYELEKSIYMLQSEWSGVTREQFFWDFMQVKDVFPATIKRLDNIQLEFTEIANIFSTTDDSGEKFLRIPEELEPSFGTGLIDKSIGDTVTGVGDTVVALINNPLNTIGSVAYAMTIGKVVDIGRGIGFAWDAAWGTGTARSDIEKFMDEQKKQLAEDESGYYKGAIIGHALSYVVFGKALRSKDHHGSGGGKAESVLKTEFVYNKNINLTENQQRRISEYIGMNSSEILNSALANEDTLRKILKNLKEGSKSGKEGFKLEADTAKLLIENKIKITEAGMTYNAKELGGRIGEVDLGTPNHIIECFSATGGKSKSISDFYKYFEGDIKQPYINPDRKEVILYAPHGIDAKKSENISSLGVKVVTSPEELITALKGDK